MRDNVNAFLEICHFQEFCEIKTADDKVYWTSTDNLEVV